MKRWKVYGRRGDYQAVKEGSCWPAFLITPIWALIYRLWGPRLGWVAATLVLVALRGDGAQGSAGHLLSFPVGVGVLVVFLVRGNEWHENALKKRGYVLLRTVAARSEHEALGMVLPRHRRGM